VLFCTIGISIVVDITITIILLMPMPLGARSKAWVFGRWLSGISGSNPGRKFPIRKNPTATVTSKGFNVQLL
jgi:hypothetical protein